MSIWVTVGVARSSTDLDSPRYNAHAFCAWLFLSVFLHCLVTVLISYKLIRQRMETVKILPWHNDKTMFSATAILIESALPLSISGIVLAVVNANPGSVGMIINGVSLWIWLAFNVSRESLTNAFVVSITTGPLPHKLLSFASQ